MNEISKKYDDMSDVFEYGSMTDEDVVKLCNQILIESKDEKRDAVLEAMYHAVFTAVDSRNISNQLEIDGILDVINNFNEEISDYIISILAYTGNRKYISVIECLGEKYEELEALEAIEELESRCSRLASES